MSREARLVKFFLNLGRTQALLVNRFDRGLGGLSFTEFQILFYLDQADEKRMRRVDLAGSIGMTASGVTRILLPMEKIGLVKSGPVDRDARVRLVLLASGGKEKLALALDRISDLAEELIPSEKIKEIESFSKMLAEIGARVLIG